MVLSACTNERSDQVVLQQQDAAEAEPRHASDPSYDSHSEAAIAAARDRDPELTNPAVTNAILIFTDQTTVDLRAQVKADDGYCQWFGVNAELTETALRRRAG